MKLMVTWPWTNYIRTDTGS